MFNFDKLDFLMKNSGVSKSFICSKVDRGNGYIADMKRLNREPPIHVIEKWASLLHTTPAFLMDETDDPSEGIIIPNGFFPVPQLTSVPIVGSIACGEPILAEQNLDGYAAVPAEWRADFILRCRGDSMLPKIQDGDMVAIRSQCEVENGQIAAVRIGNEATLKKVFRDKAILSLMPINDNYAPIMLVGDDISTVTIEGVAVGLFREI